MNSNTDSFDTYTYIMISLFTFTFHGPALQCFMNYLKLLKSPIKVGRLIGYPAHQAKRNQFQIMD